MHVPGFQFGKAAKLATFQANERGGGKIEVTNDEGSVDGKESVDEHGERDMCDNDGMTIGVTEMCGALSQSNGLGPLFANQVSRPNLSFPLTA